MAEQEEEKKSGAIQRPDIPFYHKEIVIADDVKDSEFINLFYFADCYNAINVARAKTIYDVEKKRHPSFTIGGGDWFGGGALSQYDKGDLMLQVLKDFDCHVSAIGNHEFDYGIPKALENFIKVKDSITWLCTNLNYKGDDAKVNIYDIVTIKINKKTIGVFGFLDKCTAPKLSAANGKAFTDTFDLYTDIQQMAKQAVSVLENKYKCDMIIAVSHMDGYYKQGTSYRDNAESNALSCVVKGVDLMLDASNHEAISGVIFPDLFQGSHGIDEECDELPGYCMGGVDLNYLNQIIMRTDNIRDDYSFYMHRTSNFAEDVATKKKYDDLAAHYLSASGLDQHEVELGFAFNLKTLRNNPEHVFTKVLFEAVKENAPSLDLLICPAGRIRSSLKYKEGMKFTSYHLLMIFAFGWIAVIFECTKKELLAFKDEFGAKVGTGSFPQFYPRDIESAFGDDQKIICVLPKHFFDGGDGYPFKKNKKLNEYNILEYMNNGKKLSHFAKTSQK
eukprot:23811_1